MLPSGMAGRSASSIEAQTRHRLASVGRNAGVRRLACDSWKGTSSRPGGGDDVFAKPKASDEVQLPHGSMPAHWKRRDGSGLQSADQTTILHIGFPLERTRRIRGFVDSRPKADSRPLERLLESRFAIRIHIPNGMNIILYEHPDEENDRP